jgi:hypothetical protein
VTYSRPPHAFVILSAWVKIPNSLFPKLIALLRALGAFAVKLSVDAERVEHSRFEPAGGIPNSLTHHEDPKDAKGRDDEDQGIGLLDLKLSVHRLGFLVNWNVPLIKDGIKRMVNGL